MSAESRNGSESTDPSGEATLVNSPMATRQMPTGERDQRDVNGSNLTASPTTGMSANDLDRMGWSHLDIFRRLGQVDDPEKAIEYRSRALELTPDGHPHMSDRLGRLGVSYGDRFRRLGQLEDLEKAIDCDSRALALTPDWHRDMSHRLANLGVSHNDRYRRLGQLEDLEKAIEYKSRAVALTSDWNPNMPPWLTSLGASYNDRFQRLGDVKDLEKGIECDLRALALTPNGHPDMSDWLTNLGVAYNYRFQRLEQLEDLEKSIEYKSRALALTPDGHPDIPHKLANLAVPYTNRFRRLGQLGDLEKAIGYRFRALELTPEGHPEISRRLTDLAVSYNDRFRRLGHVEDLEKAIKYEFRALALTPDAHPDIFDRLANLGVFYTDRYRRLGQLEDLKLSIEYRSRALELTPDGHPDMPRQLSSLGVSYDDQFKCLGHAGDLEKAIEYITRALALTPDGHPDVLLGLSGLGMSYNDRFQCLGNVEDLNQSIGCYSRALALAPKAHSDLPKLHFHYGEFVLSLYEHTGNVSDLDRFFRSFRTASHLSSGAPRDRFKSALRWSKLASQHTHPDIIDAYRTAIDLLPQFIWLGATPHQQYHDISTAETLASDAASAAIRSSDYSLALEWLEHARCVVWSQSLMLRSPLDQLHSSDPDLATQLKAIAAQLYNSNFEIQTPPMTPEQVGQQRLHLANQYQNLLDQARQLPGFEDFLQPVKANKLVRAARNGPIVVINSHIDRCDALFILPGHGDVGHLHLPNFTEKKAQNARSNLQILLNDMRLAERGVRRPLGQSADNDNFSSVLSTLWSDIVQPVLDYLGYLGNANASVKCLPHITWCPSGTLSFLPLHAAGDYGQSGSRIFDHVISSYTPTVTALLSSNSNSHGDSCRVVTIGQASTPGHNPLPGTVQEIAHVKAHTKQHAQYSQLLDNEATTKSVLDAMERHDWVHLACHAHQNVDDPTKSGFYLHDGTLDLASINQRSFKSKGLAFLSACQTATGDEKLPNEAIHLASGMLMAGYPSVIATMWSVVDDDAPLVADKVYARLMKDKRVGNGEAGRALHDAVAALREKVGEEAFGRWVPYIHIGS